MASTKSLDDIFDSVADESAVRALVGSLESQLASPTIHVPSQDLSSASVTNNHVNSAPVGDGTLTRLHDGTKHGVANLGQGNTVILNSDTSKSLTTTSQLLGVNSIVSSSAQPTNTITVTLAGAVPASGYINQVTSVTTQQALMNSASLATAGRTGPPEIKIVYPSQSSVPQYTSINVGSAVGNVIQATRSSGVPNGTTASAVSKPGQSHPNNSNTAAISAIQNLASVAAQQQPLLVPNQHQQGGKPQQLLARLTVREQLEQKQHDKLVPKPQLVIKPDGVSSVVVNMKTETSSVSTADNVSAASPVQTQSTINVLKSTASTPTVITVSKSGQLQPQVSQGVNMVTQMVSNPNILPGVQIVNMNAVRPGTPGTPGQKTLAPRMVLSNPVRIATSQVLGPRPGTPGPPGTVPNTITLQPGNLVRGTLLVKTENGQYQLVNVGTALAPGSNASTLPGTATYRLQSMPQVRPGWHPEESVLDSKIMCGKPQTWQPKFSRSFLENPAGHAPVRTIAPQQVTVTLPVSQPNQQVKLHQQQATGTPPHTMVQSMLHGSQPSVTIVTTAPGTYTQSGATVPTLVHQVPSTGAGTMPTQQLALQTAGLQQQSTSQNAAASQMSPDTAKKKCKNFLSTLLRLASDQPEQVATNVKNLIQGLIDGNVQPEDFTNQLQKELNSSPQPCLVPFLKKSLPYLRHSLATRELTIDGVRPPPPNTVVTLPATPTSIPQIQTRPPMPIQQAHVRLMTPGGPGTITAQVQQPGLQGILSQRLLTPAQRVQTSLAQGKSLLGSAPRPILSSAAVLSPAVVGAIQRTHPARVQMTQLQATAKEKEKRSYSSTLRDDDDINDVAAMGGVNLVEESAQILAANAEFVGTQIRSCKDENFLFTGPLQRRIKAIAARCGLDEPSSDVAALISHATQERLKTIVEKLGVIAEHRLDVIKTDPRYEVTQDVKGQIKFLEELDRLEKKRHEEQEREILMRAAKSRSKVEDPEQIKLKQKAKEMQRAEMEEVRQREANMTALLAIGPRKKLKTETQGSSSNSQASSTGNISGLGNFGSSTNRPQMMRPRVKRVNLRDLIFLMEQERDTSRSVMLYKSYLK